MEQLTMESRLPRPFQPPSLPANLVGNSMPRNNLVRLTMRWWWLTPCCVIVALAIAKIYIVKTKPVYQSSSRIYVQQNRPRIIESEDPFAVQQSATYLNTQSELIQSTPVLALVVGELPPSLSRQPKPIGYVKGGLSVGISKDDDTMTITFESTDPNEAAEVANAVVRGYATYQSNELQARVTEVQNVLEKEKIQSDEEATAKIKALANFKHENVELANESERSAVLGQQLAAISDDLTKAQIAEAEAELNYQSAQAAAADAGKIQQFVAGLRYEGTLKPNHAVEEARLNLDQLKQVRASYISAGLLAKNAQVANLDSQIASINLDKVEAEANLEDFKTYFASCGAILQQKQSLVQRLKDLYAEQQKNVSKVNAEVADYKRAVADLEADTAQAQRLEEQADSRVKSISIGADIGQAKVQVLEPAKPAFDPVRPQKMTVLGIAIGLGLVLGMSGMVVCDWLDTRLSSAEQVLADLTVPVLGTVPHIAKSKDVSTAGREVLLDPMSEVAEGYRSIRTALYFGMHDEHARTILVTSPVAGEGKTTLVSNLAISMAQAGRRTLILDADFRKPKQHVVFGISADIGLSTVLAGGASIADAIQPTSIDRLDLLPCGPIPMNPSESLNSHGFAELLRGLAEEYDCVLLDSAPIVPVTDGRILAAICDLTVLVLRAEQSTRKTSLYARNSLYSVGAEIAGIVLNDVTTWRSAGYSTYSYRSGLPANGSAMAEPVIARVPDLDRAQQISLVTPVSTKVKTKRVKP